MVGKDVDPGNLQADLKSGVTLCELINKIKDRSVRKINQSEMPFAQRENIQSFCDAVNSLPPAPPSSPRNPFHQMIHFTKDESGRVDSRGGGGGSVERAMGERREGGRWEEGRVHAELEGRSMSGRARNMRAGRAL